MDQRVKNLWLKALRTGEYKQGHNQLRANEDNTYCCLGVLCDLHRRETGDGEWTTDDLYRTSNDVESLGLPPSVAEWAGLPSGDPKVSRVHFSKDFTGNTVISTLNDGFYSYTIQQEMVPIHDFAAIADVIEEEL